MPGIILWCAVIHGALLIVLVWLSVVKYMRQERMVFFALALGSLIGLLYQGFLGIYAVRGAGAPAGLGALFTLSLSVYITGLMCEAAGGISRTALVKAGPALFVANAALMALGGFKVIDPAAFVWVMALAQALLAGLGMYVVLNKNSVPSPHYAVQALLFIFLGACLTMFSQIMPAAWTWPWLAASAAQVFALFSWLFYCESLGREAPEPASEDDGPDTRQAVYSACARMSRELQQLDATSSFDHWFGQGVDIMARALRDQFGYQHVSLAMWNGHEPSARAASGFLLPSGLPPEVDITLTAAIMHQLASTGEPIVSTDVRSDPRLAGCVFNALAWRSAALVPLKAGNGPFCVLIVGDRSDGRPLDQQDIFTCIVINDFLNMFLSYLYTRSEVFAAADQDPVTLQRNYSAFQKILEETMIGTDKYGGTFALVLFDIDKFYYINDKLGFERGDQILRELAAAISKYSDGGNVGRVGPDEFAILLHGAVEHVREKLEHMVTEINQLAEEICREMPLSISTAFTIYPYDFLEQTSVFGKMREALAAGSSSKAQMLRVKCN